MTEDELEIKKFEEHKRAEEKRQKAEALLLEQTRPFSCLRKPSFVRRWVFTCTMLGPRQ